MITLRAHGHNAACKIDEIKYQFAKLIELFSTRYTSMSCERFARKDAGIIDSIQVYLRKKKALTNIKKRGIYCYTRTLLSSEPITRKETGFSSSRLLVTEDGAESHGLADPELVCEEDKHEKTDAGIVRMSGIRQYCEFTWPRCK